MRLRGSLATYSADLQELSAWACISLFRA
jgi:hypothetical protein